MIKENLKWSIAYVTFNPLSNESLLFLSLLLKSTLYNKASGCQFAGMKEILSR